LTLEVSCCSFVTRLLYWLFRFEQLVTGLWKVKRKIFATILVIVLCLSIPTVSIYLCYVDLADANFHSFDLKFQNLDEENVASDYRDDLDRCESQGFFDVLILQTTLFGQSPFSCLQQRPCIQKAFVLRC
jgi:hypothetical protein